MKRHISQEPLYGIAVYNPGILGKQELIRLFVARRILLQQIMDDLGRENPHGIPQHRLLVGARGMGKTTLLRRISYGVEDDEKLGKIWLPLTFPEEQYNIARLSDLWLNCLDAVSDALERQGKHEEAEALDCIIDALPDGNEDERARTALNALLEQGKKTGQRLLLLIDNIDLIFERLAKDHWTIREMLSKEGAPLLIGATARPLEPTYEYQGAFYDFFKINNLNKLQLAEMHEVLRNLAEEMDAPQVSHLLEQDPARIRVLYDLTGGNPRTTVLLFSVLSQGIDGDVRSDLERLLDQCTPLYKARFEELSNQAQQVVDGLALHWDPVPASAIAERAHLDVNIVSSHLNRLSEQGIVEKVRLFPKKKTGFQIAERFFNIWYLMRASRRMRRKLIWLSRFLKSFYSQEDLQSLARRYFVQGQTSDGSALLKHAEYGFALADALDDKGWRRALEHSASRVTMEIQEKFRELLSDSAIDPNEIDQQTLTMEQIRKKILSAKVNWGGVDKQEYCTLLCGAPWVDPGTKTKFAEVFSKLSVKTIQEGYETFRKAQIALEEMVGDERLAGRIYDAIGMGIMKSASDVEGAESAQHIFTTPELVTFALGEQLEEKQGDEYLQRFREQLSKTNCTAKWALLLLANTEHEIGLHEAAAKTFKKITELYPDDSEAWLKLGTLLGSELRKYDEAMTAFERCLQLDPEDSAAWGNYGIALDEVGRIRDAENACRKAVELDPGNWEAWNSLGSLLAEHKNDLHAAEEAFRHSAAISKNEPTPYFNLAQLLWESGQAVEAEKAIKNAIKLAPEKSFLWNMQGIIQSHP
jgi:tetratricopeptide (TPR) repeat protein